MIELELEFVAQSPERIAVLSQYAVAIAELAETEAAVKKQRTASCDADSQVVAPQPAHVDDLADGEISDHDASVANRPTKWQSRWVSRIARIEGIESEELSKIHGQLIAYGLLKCDLASRDSGMVYQLSSVGKQVLARLANEQTQLDTSSSHESPEQVENEMAQPNADEEGDRAAA